MDNNYPTMKSMPAPKLSPDGVKNPVFTQINSKIHQSISDCTRWTLNQVKWHRMRMRIKKVKTFPFEGCSNIRMPTGETKLRKLKASLVNVLTGIRPIVQVVPSPSGSHQTALKIEKFIDHLVMDVIKIKPKLIICIDQMLEKGFQLLKPYWNYEQTGRTEMISVEDFEMNEAIAFFSAETPKEIKEKFLIDKFEIDMNERVKDENMKSVDKAINCFEEGDEEVELYCKDVIRDHPDVSLASPERVYVPADSGYDPQDCGFITHEVFLPLRKIRQNVDGKGWDKKAVESITQYKGVDLTKMTDIEKDLREGITRMQNPSELVKIWEFYGWMDLDEDGEEEKVLITAAPEFSQVLRAISIPYDNGKFPFVKFFYELIDDRWFSHRGVIEIMEDIIKEIDIQHMSKLDNMTIRNAPMFVYRAGMVNPNQVQFIPNQGIPVHGMNPLSDTLAMINNQNSNVDYSYEREEQILEMKVQELIGQTDFSLQSMINRRQPRTLGEVEMQQQSQQSVFSLDAEVVKGSFEETINWIWDLWCQYGSEEYEFDYFGKDGYEKIKIGKEDRQSVSKISVRGNDQNTSPQIRLQKTQMVLQMVSNPIALQTGVVTPQNIAETYKRAFQEMQIDNWEMLVNDKPQPPPNPEQQKNPLFEKLSMTMADLTDSERAQILMQLGIKPDMQTRALDKQHELIQTQMDHADNLKAHEAKMTGHQVSALAHLMRGQSNGGKEKSAN